MNNKLRLSALWWIIGLLITAAIVSPFAVQLMDKSIFWTNVLFSFGFVILSRTLIQLKQTYLAEHFYLRIAFFIFLFPMIFLGIEQINHFQYVVDYDDLNLWLSEGFKTENLRSIRSYIQSEFMFLGVGTVIVAILLLIRLVLFTWKTLNRQISA
jgi:hypothetical protein